MPNYYNFTQTNYKITYEPYLYDKQNSKAHLFSGIAIVCIGVALSACGIWRDSIYFGILFGGIFIVNGLFRILIEGKTQIEFNKQDDSLYKMTPFAKKKKIALSNIYNIAISSKSDSYTYNVTSISKPGAKAIEISSYISNDRVSKPEIIFLENEIIPTLIAFLQIDSEAMFGV